MELDQLDEALGILSEVISEFPVGAKTVDDFRPVQEKIEVVRNELKYITARSITLQAIIDYQKSNSSQNPSNETLNELSDSTTDLLINTKAIKVCYQSKAIRDGIDNSKVATPETKEKYKKCLAQLYAINDRLSKKNEIRKQRLEHQAKLKLDSHKLIYEYQDYLKALEAKKQEMLQENDPNLAHQKEKIHNVINKINTMKKLITNMIASMSQDLYKNRDLIDILVVHKSLLNFEEIREEVNDQSSEGAS